MLDLSRNLIHLRWLLKLVDFRAAGELSWGSAVLATLYKEMCGVMRPNKAKIGGCLSLLQSWARFRFPFLRPRVDHLYTFSLITRWNHLASYVGIPTSLEDIRRLLDQRSEAQVPLVNSSTVEMHQSNRVLQQFEFQQLIPVAPEVFDDKHKVDLRQLHTD
ncbi:hypothetical protein J1N35_011223 [Gossypium stocksii]|uniref:Aminotransferase-like plant mobile domain-containing protein n=1 Tax=Gossypium stocksii TaxID=47602 RepID=A0A9D3W420_9ROSI|nr:hypothetical protein J1N35_011223 [Gossypium stocksii]